MIEPTSDALHVLGGEPGRIGDDRKRIPGERVGAEHINEVKGSSHGLISCQEAMTMAKWYR
jgi:hypothetical protein